MPKKRRAPRKKVLYNTAPRKRDAARKANSLGSPPAEHLQQMSLYLNQAARELERAKSHDTCRAAGLQLFNAQESLGRARAHLDSGGAVTRRQRKAFDTFSQKLNEATFNYIDGPCLRRTAYDK